MKVETVRIVLHLPYCLSDLNDSLYENFNRVKLVIFYALECPYYIYRKYI